MHTSTVTLEGRDSERATLDAFVAEPSGPSLILRGDSGIGKTALLDYAVRLAAQRGDAVIRVSGVETESELVYAGLHQILYPLLGRSADLDDSARAVFETFFEQRAHGSPSVMTLGIAVLHLLETAAGDDRLLLVVDDAHWFDAASAEVCGFVARRLRAGAVKMLLAVRTDVESRWDAAAVPELGIGALSDAAAARLLDRRYPGLAARTRRITLDNAVGNPLALVELPTHIPADPDDADELFDDRAVPVPHRLQQLYRARITALDERVRTELLRAALDTTITGSDSGYRLRGVEQAATAGLLDIDPADGRYRFRHPLVRAAVIHTATLSQRRAAHLELAAASGDDLERRATHLAAVAEGPDDSVAAALETAAGIATRRGGAGTAVALLTKAAQLSERSWDRSRRLADAAFVAGHAARLDLAQRLARTPLAEVAESPAMVLAAAYSSFYGDGDIRSTTRRVRGAIEQLRAVSSEPNETLTRLVDLLLAMSQYSGDAQMWADTRALVTAVRDLLPPASLLYSDTWSDVVRHGSGAAQRVTTAGAGTAEPTPWDITRLAVSAYHLDITGEFRTHLQRMVDRELDTGAVSSGIVMSHVIMLDQLATGEWEAAERTGQRALRRATELGFELFVQQSRVYLAQLAALRGRVEQARRWQAEVESWAGPRGLGFLTQLANATGTLAALGEGDFDTAYRHAVAITAPGEFTAYAHQASRGLLDLVEAAVYSGRMEQARDHVDSARRAGFVAISPRLAIITHGAGALTAASGEEAAASMAHAENHPAAAHFPFELARIRLAYGIRLRHANSRTAARPHLVAAAECFDRLGAPLWATRAHAELRALGVSLRIPEPDSVDLTWQERRIAELAAAGLTNKEIGKQLYLSPRTISSHLYRVFPKLGITTRVALRDALARQPQTV